MREKLPVQERRIHVKSSGLGFWQITATVHGSGGGANLRAMDLRVGGASGEGAEICMEATRLKGPERARSAETCRLEIVCVHQSEL